MKKSFEEFVREYEEYEESHTEGIVNVEKEVICKLDNILEVMYNEYPEKTVKYMCERIEG